MTNNALKLFNTETKLKEPISLGSSKWIKMYTCGPTIYNFVHIGNLRTFVFEDILRRTLKFFGYPLVHVMNLTDVDDKTIKGALAQKVSLKTFVKPFKEAFFEDIGTLNIERAEHYPEATDYIDEMIKMIQTLLDKGYAYRGHEGSIYFKIRAFPSYGRLSHFKLQDLVAGASERVEADEYDKENVSDFVLWKAYDKERDGPIFWQSPFGLGRPGWHIECSAMATKLLGETIDIHVGGIDNMFPHHENEIAQSECCTGHLFVKHWLHSEHLLVDGKKMSKSLGNFYTLRDLLSKGFTGGEIRYLLLQGHYRSQLNFTFDGLIAARHSLERLEDLMVRLSHIKIASHPLDDHFLSEILEKAFDQFKQALGDDLAMPEALAVMFDLVREINSLCDQNRLNEKHAQRTIDLFKRFDSVLGCIPFERKFSSIPNEVYHLLEQRETARKEKNWKKADECRELILQQGYVIEDTKEGPLLKLK